MAKERLTWIDYAKWFSIILVVSFHGPYRIDNYIGDFLQTLRMPAFFMIAGLLYRQEKYKSLLQFVKHRSIQLLIPYSSFFIIFYVLWLLFGRSWIGGEDLDASIYQPLLEYVKGDPKIVVAPCWFLCCLFTIQVMYYILKKYLNRKMLVAVMIIAPLLSCIPIVEYVPWKFREALMFMPYYAFANLYKLEIKTMGRQSVSIALLQLVLGIIGIYIKSSLGELLQTWLTVACGLMILPTYILLIKFLSRNGKLDGIALFYGKNTIIILALSNYIIGALYLIIGTEFCLSQWLTNGIYTIVVFIICILPIKFINKYTPYIIGRGNIFEQNKTGN